MLSPSLSSGVPSARVGVVADVGVGVELGVSEAGVEGVAAAVAIGVYVGAVVDALDVGERARDSESPWMITAWKQVDEPGYGRLSWGAYTGVVGHSRAREGDRAAQVEAAAAERAWVGPVTWRAQVDALPRECIVDDQVEGPVHRHVLAESVTSVGGGGGLPRRRRSAMGH